jgi:hypothetical protein
MLSFYHYRAQILVSSPSQNHSTLLHYFSRSNAPKHSKIRANIEIECIPVITDVTPRIVVNAYITTTGNIPLQSKKQKYATKQNRHENKKKTPDTTNKPDFSNILLYVITVTLGPR